MQKLPTQSLIQLIGCLAVVAVVGAIMILPAYRGLGEKDRLAGKIRLDIESQKVLTPLFQEMLKKAKLKDTGELVPVNKTPWPQEKASDLLVQFEAMGQKHELTVEVRLPDAATLIKEATHLTVDIAARGHFSNLRAFLIDLFKAPFIDHVERIQILAGDGLEEIRLKVWVLQTSTGGR